MTTTQATTTAATTTVTAAAVHAVTLDVTDIEAARQFYAQAFGLATQLRFRAADTATSNAPGFRGFTLSLTTSQPGNVKALVDAAVAAGATVVKPVTKSFWGCGGVVQAPDGAIWKVACSAKKDSAPATKDFDDLVLLLGVQDVAATRRLYVEHGFEVAKSFGRKYVEFAAGKGSVKLALYGHRALAKDAGVPATPADAHGISLQTDATAFTDPDGFHFESDSASTADHV